MEVQARSDGRTHRFSVSESATVSELMQAISDGLHVPPSRQQLVRAGAKIVLSDSPLSSVHITNAARLMLVVMEDITGGTPKPAARPARPESLDRPPHAPIVARGAPPGCPAPQFAQTALLPKGPLVVYDESGRVAKLSFETDAFWIEPEGAKGERIFFQEVNTFCVQEMPRELNKPGYFALCLSSSVRKWLYFIPGQYSAMIQKLLAKKTDAKS
jgi:hypothetical protein